MHKRRFVEGFISIVWILSLFSVGVVNMVTFAQATNCETLPSLNLKQTVPSASSYNVWLLVKKETPTATPYVRVDSGQCQQVALPAGTDWEWVSGSKGAISETLVAGEHTFAFSVNGGAVLLDKVLVTNDKNCTPKADGNNCIEKVLDFVVDGIDQNSTVAGERKVSAVIAANSVDKATFEFFLDGLSVGQQQASPYCLIDDPANAAICGLYNFSSLAAGSHTLKVVGKTTGDQIVEKNVTFEVGAKNIASPTANQTALSNVDPALTDNLVLTVAGISTNDVVKGARTVSAAVTGNSKPVTVRFSINTTDINAATAAPYCLVVSGKTCGDWNSESLVNGSYNLYVTATSEGSKTKIVAIPFKIDNPKIPLTTSATDQEVIVGNPGQQASGTVKVTLPTKKNKTAGSGRKIVFYIDDKEIGSTYDSNPVIEFDTAQFTNGKHKLSARITSVLGESTTVASDVEVKNDLYISVNSWIKNNLLGAIAAGIVVGAILFIAIRSLLKVINNRKLLKMHNISADYATNQKKGKLSLHNHYMQGIVALVLVVSGTFAVLSLGNTYAGVGVGFTDDVENGVAAGAFPGLSLGYENNMTLAYARLNYTQAAATQAVTAVSSFEAESMTLGSYLGRVQDEPGTSGGQSLTIWSTASAVKTVDAVAAGAVTIKARGDQCNGAPIMQLKIDGKYIGTANVESSTYTDYSFPVNLSIGSHSFDIAFTNDEFVTCDRNLYVDKISLNTASASVPTPVVATSFNQNFDTGTNAASINMTDISGSGPHNLNGKIVVKDGRINADPNTNLIDSYATANGTFTADQYSEADLIIGSSTAGQYTGVNVRANIEGPSLYSWYKLETVSSATQVRVLTLKDNKIAAEYYATIPGGLKTNTTYKLRLEVSGTTIKGYVNGALLINVTDNNIANGKPGLNIYGGQTWLDNFSAGNLGAAPPVNPTPTTPTPTPTATAATTFEGESMVLPSNAGRRNTDASASGGQRLFILGITGGVATATKTVTTAAGKGMTIKARGDLCNGAPIMSVKMDGKALFSATVNGTSYMDYSFATPIAAGSHAFEVAFINDEFTTCDRNLYVDTVTVTANAPATSTPQPSVPTPTPTVPTTPSTPTPTPTPIPTPTTTMPTGMASHNGMGPMINNALIPARAVGANGPRLAYNTGYVPFADDIGAFRTDCRVSHITYDDPIVFPGQPNAAHLHTFFGNTGVNAYSTQNSIETTGASTCNGGTLNRSAYWMPTVIDTKNGAPVMPTRVLVYYKTSYYGISPSQVTAAPAGLRMIAGDSRSTSVQGSDPYGHSISSFACNSESFPFPVVTGGTSIDTYCPPGARQLFMEIRFPQCWNGRDLDSYDHKSHMAYPTGYGCPAGYPVAIPEIQLRVQYDYYADRSSWRLSSDNYSGAPGGYSSHADWFNGWDRTILDSIRANCWSVSRDCQVDNIGNGQRLIQ